MFDKDSYWQRRALGKRGQGVGPRLVTNVATTQPGHVVTIGTKIQIVDRKTARSMGEHRGSRDDN